jgi:hypothetical protein
MGKTKMERRKGEETKKWREEEKTYGKTKEL